MFDRQENIHVLVICKQTALSSKTGCQKTYNWLYVRHNSFAISDKFVVLRATAWIILKVCLDWKYGGWTILSYGDFHCRFRGKYRGNLLQGEGQYRCHLPRWGLDNNSLKLSVLFVLKVVSFQRTRPLRNTGLEILNIFSQWWHYHYLKLYCFYVLI